MDQEVAKTLGELELKLQELERELTTIGRHEKPAEPLQTPGRLIDEAVERENGDDRTGAEANAEEQAIADGDGFGGPAIFGGEEVPAQPGATIEHDWTVETRETAYGEIPTPPPPPVPPDSPLPSPPSRSPAPTPQPPPPIPPGPPPPSTPPGPPTPSTPPGPLPPFTPPGPPPSTPPGPSAPYTPPGAPAPLTSSGPDPRRPAAAEENQSVDLAELVRFRDKLARTMDELIEEYSRLLSQKPPSRPWPGA